MKSDKGAMSGVVNNVLLGTSVRPKILLSFSGGRTSAVMTKLCFEKYQETHDIKIVFANTGQEHPKTLEFVDKCDKHFGWNVVWLEAVVDPRPRKGITSKVVTYETVCRDLSIFEEMCSKYGLPMTGWGNCTRDLKEYPIKHYVKKALGWDDYWTAIGIRVDEVDRVNSNHRKNRFLYPLVDAGWRKEDVKAECATWPFDLELPGEHWGNCTWCWKKSLRKLMTLAQEDVSIFNGPMKLDLKYRFSGAQKIVNGQPDLPNGRRMFRGMKSTGDVIHEARTRDFKPYADKDEAQLMSMASYDVELDTGSACGDSCEIGSDGF